MCGIFGEISFGSSLLTEGQFLELNALSRNRGPDSQGFYRKGNLQLGFNRLAIIDLREEGNQPVTSPSGRYVMVFNGEIYNFLDLKHRFGFTHLRSNSDTEVLIHLIEQFGIKEAIPLLNGMFAIGLFDQLEQRLHLVRDFAGIKPLFVGISENKVVFASQFDQVFLHPAFKRKDFDSSGLRDYLQFGYMVPPRTVFRDIFQLQPGQRWSFDGKGQVQRETYLAFDVDHLGTIPSHSSHALTLVEESLSEATQRQLIADRPLGTFFSGGIDSPLVTALALRHQKQLRGFTFGIQNSSMDESSIASEYAEHLRLSLQIESSTEQSIHAMSSTHFRAFSEPIGDYSTLATFVITHLASQHFTILLSGDGGDELFWGYPRMLNSTRHRHWFALPKFSRRGLSGLLRKAGKSVSYGVLFPTLGSWYRSQHAHLKDVWVEKLLPGIPNTPEIDRLYTFNSRGKRKEEVLAWLRWNEFYGHMQRTLLKVDRMSMAHSLEVRVPFLDKQVLEASLRVAPQLKTPNDLKWPLKRLLEKQLQGGHVFEKKRGFSLPIHGLINSQYLGELRALAHEPTGLFAHEFAQGGLSQLISNFCGPNDVGDWGIWHLIALHQWSKKYGF